MKIWFEKALLTWFATQGRHDLPWQHPRTPYRVWISEIMLQQTQVATVIPYFERFLKRFPDLGSLATEPLESVLALWTGLGYYARARNLHRAAILLYTQHQGLFPETQEGLEQLPGIGPSTAGAILSQAFGRPAVVLDANVKRVLLRFYGLCAYPNDPKIHKQLWSLAQSLLPSPKNAAHYTQAFMDLGATCCTIKTPLCTCCPLKKRCQAFQNNTVSNILQPKPKTLRVHKSLSVLIIWDPTQKQLLLEKRPLTGIWGGLWSFPELPVTHSVKAWCKKTLGPFEKALTFETHPPGKHLFTHYTLSYYPIEIRLPKIRRTPLPTVASPYAWVPLNSLETLGLSGLVKKLVNKQLSKT